MEIVRKEYSFKSATGLCDIYARSWAPADKDSVKAIFQITHGMAEHGERYARFAKRLCEHGYAVFAQDHIGHGKSVASDDDLGYFGEKDGWRDFVIDCRSLTDIAREEYPGKPVVFFGHSMGSFYARQYLCEWGDELDGAIIMGTGYQPKALVQLARTICRVLAVFHGWHYRSKLVARLSFLGYNKGLEGRTAHDWLNRDPVEVDRYRADERCTFIFTLNAYYSMFSGILRLYDPALLARVPKDLPMLFLAGDADPVGEQGAGVKRAVKSLLDAGVKNIEVKLYPSARHELLVELNREEVFADIGDWLERRL